MLRPLAAAAMILAAAGPALAQSCKPQRAESDVAGVRLSDERSAETLLGKDPKDSYSFDNDWVRMLSSDGRLEVRFTIHPGGVMNEYQEIEVLPATAAAAKARRLPVADFRTERGIGIGTTQEELVRLLGPCHKTERRGGGVTRIAYRISDPDHALVRRVGLPDYFANYDLRNGRIVRLHFGFEYP